MSDLGCLICSTPTLTTFLYCLQALQILLIYFVVPVIPIAIGRSHNPLVKSQVLCL
jgi:hypothetical protein